MMKAEKAYSKNDGRRLLKVTPGLNRGEITPLTKAIYLFSAIFIGVIILLISRGEL